MPSIRKPLIVNASANQIQELPAGDSLDGISNLTATGTIAATSYTGSGAQLTGIITVPVGGVIMWGGSTNSMPTGFRLCNGDVLSRSEFSALFAVLGTSHNTTGESGTEFRIPDLRDRFVVGAHADNSDTTYPQIKPGATGGSANAVLVAHNHGVPTTGGGGYDDPSYVQRDVTDGNPLSNRSTTTVGKDADGTSNTSQDGSNANLPPYYALCYIIKHTATSTGTSTGGSGFTVAYRSGAYTLTKSTNTNLTDVGKLLIVSGTGDITVPQGTFFAGDVISILATQDKTIKQGTGSGVAPVLKFAGSDVTGDRSLADNGVCTIICQYASDIGDNFIISGSGLS